MRLYEIASEFKAQMSVIEDTPIDEITQAMWDGLAGVEANLEEKVMAYARFIRNLAADKDAAEAEEKRLRARKQAYANKIERLKAMLVDVMEDVGATNVKDGTLTVFTAISTCCVIDDEELVPEPYSDIVETKVFDKAAIKAALKDDPKSVPGARLESTLGVRMR